MELTIVARFHAREGKEQALAALIAAQTEKTRAEPGCLEIHGYGAVRNPRLFFIHSRWKDEAAFEAHAALANTEAFVGEAEKLIDHPFDATRARPLR